MLLMTAHATVESAIEAMKLGRARLPAEAVRDRRTARRRARARWSTSACASQNRYLMSERDEEFNHYGIVGRSRPMQEVLRKLELVAETKSTVLITGETGTGKELVARAIHDRSAQRAHAADQGELRRDPRDAARVGAVRPRARRLHRRDGQQARASSRWPTAARSSSTRSGRCRRRCRPSCCACSRSASSSRSAPSGRSAWTCASSRPPTATSGRWSRTASSGRTSSTA